MGIYLMFDANCLKLYEPSMLDGNEEEFVTLTLEELVAQVGTSLEEDTFLHCKERATR
jgi:hypothetical protein